MAQIELLRCALEELTNKTPLREATGTGKPSSAPCSRESRARTRRPTPSSPWRLRSGRPCYQRSGLVAFRKLGY